MAVLKPLNRKLYGSIPHLPGSRMGPKDIGLHPGQVRICTEKARKNDRIVVTEKVDGSCCGAAMIDGKIVPLTRAGYHARTSPFEQHHLFADWIEARADKLVNVLNEGERIVGEWLAQAHGTRYLIKEPFMVFDLFTADNKRLTYQHILNRVGWDDEFKLVHLLNDMVHPMTAEEAMEALDNHWDTLLPQYGDEREGVVWRVECNDTVDFMAKYVRPSKVDGQYLPELSGLQPIWNWRPA